MNTNIQRKFPQPIIKKDDKRARILIWSVSIIVFVAVAFLSGIKFNFNLSFDPHIFAEFNAVVNSCVAILLVAALVAVKKKHYLLHKKIMIAAIILSVLFLVSYICHHLLSGETKFGDLNHDGILSANENLLAGSLRYVYYAILITHIPLAALILPFILFSAYRALSGDYIKHKKLSRITWPIWFYVAVSGVVVYLLISPYYS
jgi:putative membrane protein